MREVVEIEVYNLYVYTRSYWGVGDVSQGCNFGNGLDAEYAEDRREDMV